MHDMIEHITNSDLVIAIDRDNNVTFIKRRDGDPNVKWNLLQLLEYLSDRFNEDA